MTKTKHNKLKPFELAFAGLLLAGTANATEGYFQNGVGARHKALAGAGSADGKDATAISLNPAGLVHADHELSIAASIFAPDRGFKGSGGPGFTPVGEFDGNETSFFVVPDVSYARPWGENGAIGLALVGNGGMNTDYAAITNPACGPGNGVFCGGKAGVNLTQAFIYGAYAHDFDGFSIGIAPVVAIQQFEAKGLGAFAPGSSDPANLTNNDTSTSTGFGLKLGGEMELAPNFRVAAAYQTEINMSEFDEYAGLFADGGDFDIPANYQLGVAYDFSENLTVMADYRHISYSDIGSIANFMAVPLPLGSNGGPGFHWKDVDAYKIGVEYEGQNGWTWRGGFATNNDPVTAEAVTFNILAPGVVTKHFTAGFEKDFEGQSLQVALMYAPEETVSGIELAGGMANPGRTIELRMNQFELTAGWTWKFGG